MTCFQFHIHITNCIIYVCDFLTLLVTTETNLTWPACMAACCMHYKVATRLLQGWTKVVKSQLAHNHVTIFSQPQNMVVTRLKQFQTLGYCNLVTTLLQPVYNLQLQSCRQVATTLLQPCVFCMGNVLHREAKARQFFSVFYLKTLY